MTWFKQPFTLLCIVSSVSVIRQMIDPAPLGSLYNPNIRFEELAEHDSHEPFESFSSPVCRGRANDMKMGMGFGDPVASWPTNSDQSFLIESNLTASVSEGLGSCQASISHDDGITWVVLHSYIGNCPPKKSEGLKFRVPSDTPQGWVLFAWTWFRAITSGQMYMNCAVVEIVQGNDMPGEETIAFLNRPRTFVANTNDSPCITEENSNLEFAEPGGDVTKEDSLDTKSPICTVTTPSSTESALVPETTPPLTEPVENSEPEEEDERYLADLRGHYYDIAGPYRRRQVLA